MGRNPSACSIGFIDVGHLIPPPNWRFLPPIASAVATSSAKEDRRRGALVLGRFRHPQL
jgi:hypothetical protein